MLATVFEEKPLRFPYFAAPKPDGIRCLVVGGHEVTRTGNRVPNIFVREFFEKHGELLDRLDGELVVGNPTAPDCFSRAVSGIMSQGCRPCFSYFVFDVVDRIGTLPFTERWKEAQERARGWSPNVGLVLQEPVKDLESLTRLRPPS